MRTHLSPVARLGIALLAGCLCLAAPATGVAQATLLQDPLDPVYADLDRLAALGALDHTLVGQRPYSRRHIAQLVARAESTLVQHGGNAGNGAVRVISPDDHAWPERRVHAVEQVLARLHADFAWEMARLRPGTFAGAAGARDDSLPRAELALLRAAGVDLTTTSSRTRAIPRSNGLGEIDAAINPLLANRHGEPLVRGANVVLQTTHSLQSPHLAAAFTPQLYVQSATGSSSRALGNVQELYLRFVFGNVALDAGREYQLWGQGRDVGLLNSNNSPGLDLVKLSSDAPFQLPWMLRRLGPTMLSLFYADLGAQQNFPHPYFIGYKASIAPAAWLELGGTVYTKAGGKGAPAAPLGKRIGDVFPFLEANFFGNRFGAKGNFNFSDRYAGLDSRIHIPSARGAVLYAELLLNDFDIRRLESVFWEDAGHVAGLQLPRLTDDGRLALNVEYHHTGIRYYEHEQFLSGQTLRGVLVGDPLGPDAQGGYATLDWARTARQRLSIAAAVERRSDDQYAFLPEPQFGFRRTALGLREWRYRLTSTWRTIPERRRAGLLVEVGYERVRAFDFVPSNDRNGLLARAGVEVRFR